MKRIGFLIALAGLWLAPACAAGPVGGRGAGQGQLRGDQAAAGDRDRGPGPGRRSCGHRRGHARADRPGPRRHDQDLRARRGAAVLQRQLLAAADGGRPAAAGVLPVWSRHLHPAGRDRYRASGVPAHAGGRRQPGRRRGAGQDRRGARRDPARTLSSPDSRGGQADGTQESQLQPDPLGGLRGRLADPGSGDDRRHDLAVHASAHPRCTVA